MTGAPSLPPHDERAEIAVLGGVLLDPDQWQGVSDLPPAAFYRENHRLIWLALHALMTSGISIDLVNLAGHLERTKTGFSNNRTALDDAGGLTYLIGLSDQTPFAFRTPEYAATVRDMYARRLLLEHANRVQRMVYGIECDPQPTASVQDFMANVPRPAARAENTIITGPEADSAAVEYLRLLASGLSPALRTGSQTWTPSSAASIRAA
ncbi:hypothetical protein EHF33_20200 (plasmid) [Deinococcus psychrotolerans]|uniref:DNA helicase DnaB-like N-terminal domain-containing protein n=1 Tax=Deinococcus psychrotolerans TaxID=2489213 RepID=A0A3G8YRS0_9DEIO|nr:DnaB-like helicase N-terminal domain-containing protein [Deinococcus psychrotolerans]AZI45234.1 hypothetical protein EHF33_20200 [Deinococcus psychrotolerans]